MKLIPRFLLVGLLLPVPVALNAQHVNIKLDPQRSEVHWTLKDSLHSVHGSFAVKEGRFSIYPEPGKEWGRAEGEVVISTPTGASGNKERDARMHREFLESAKYTVATFRARRFKGVLRAGPIQSVTVEGTLLLHGVERPMTLEFKVLFDSNRVAAETGFRIPYMDWGIKDPSIPMIRVDNQVDVDVAARGWVEFIPES